MKLLVVDDIAVNRRLLRAQLDGEGHDTLEAANGVEALAIIRQEEAVDGVISDILMPEMDGFRLCLELRQDPRFASLPFVLYTSTYNSPSDRQLADTAGADAYLTKPSPVAVIINALEAARSKVRHATDPSRHAADETQVLKQYNEALVRKLEDKNFELMHAIDHLNDLNDHLERRVEQRTRELESANRELEAFSYSVAHDLRSPLSAISGFMRLLQHSFERDLNEQGRHYLEVVIQNIRRMSAMIDDLLSLAQMGRHELIKQDVDLRTLVEDGLKSMREAHPDRAVDVEIGELPTCNGDPVLLQHVINNLIGNAFKYTAQVSAPRIEIGMESRDEGTVIFIRDNGAGFDMRYADQLFVAFKRLHSRKDFEGTGVGLAIVDRIVKRHGGRVWASAEPGKGATFYFTLGGQGSPDIR